MIHQNILSKFFDSYFFTKYFGYWIWEIKSNNELCDLSVSLILQSVCRLSFTWHSLYLDRLYYMLWELCKHSWWMWLLRRCWWSRVTTIVYNGFDSAWTIYCDWHILQRAGGHNGWTTNLAAALSYTCEKDANKSECSHLPSYLF